MARCSTPPLHWCATFQYTARAYPLKGIRQILTCFAGELCVTILDANKIEGMEIQQILAWLKELGWNGLESCSTFHLLPKDVVYIPVGCFALVTGIENPPSSCKEPQRRKVFLFYPAPVRTIGFRDILRPRNFHVGPFICFTLSAEVHSRPFKCSRTPKPASATVQSSYCASAHKSCPSVQPSVRPSVRASVRPCVRPSVRPSDRPTVRPSDRPSVRPTVCPSTAERTCGRTDDRGGEAVTTLF